MGMPLPSPYSQPGEALQCDGEFESWHGPQEGMGFGLPGVFVLYIYIFFLLNVWLC